MERCATCKHWGGKGGEKFHGLCGHPLHQGRPGTDYQKVMDVTDPASIVTGKDFGCVNWEEAK